MARVPKWLNPMSAAVLRSESDAARASAAKLAPVRATAHVALTCAQRSGATRIADLAESGGYRMKFPKVEDDCLEAVIINTGGGVAGGDRIRFDVTAHAGAKVTVASPAAERVYRSLGPATEIDIGLNAADGAALHWLPQPTILFSGARLERRISADISGNASLLIAEMTAFGRVASGEKMGPGLLRDHWRIRRDGRLIFAETTRLDGNMAELLARPAVAGGAHVTGLLLWFDRIAEEARDCLRTRLADIPLIYGLSAWRGMLVMRVLSASLAPAQSCFERAIEVLTRSAAPRTWAN